MKLTNTIPQINLDMHHGSPSNSCIFGASIVNWTNMLYTFWGFRLHVVNLKLQMWQREYCKNVASRSLYISGQNDINSTLCTRLTMIIVSKLAIRQYLISNQHVDRWSKHLSVSSDLYAGTNLKNLQCPLFS
jgi:hypothetical protein